MILFGFVSGLHDEPGRLQIPSIFCLHILSLVTDNNPS